MPLGGLLPYDDAGGLMGAPDINPQAQQQIKNRTLLSLGLNMLANSGPSMTPTSLGQVIGQSGQQALSTGDQLRQKALQGALLRRKVSQEDREQRRQEKLRETFAGAFDERGQFNPAALSEIAKTDPDAALNLYRQNVAGGPASVEEFRFFQNLPEGDQDTFMNLKRGGRVVDVAGVPHLIGADNRASPLSDLGSEASARQTLKQAEEAGKGTEQRANTIISSGLEAAKGIPALKRSIGLLNNVSTGGLQNVALRAKQLFGVEGADEGELSANLGQAVLGDLRETFGAQFTEREGARLERIRASFGKSPETNKRLLSQSLQIAMSAAERAQDAAIKRKDFDTAKSIQELVDFEFDFEGQQGGASSAGSPGAGGFKVLRVRDQ